MIRTPDLFTPLRVGEMDLPNRVAMAPMTRNRAGEGNVPTEINARYYEQRAGAGLIVTEGSQVSPRGVGYPGTPGIHTPEQVAGWRRVTDAVHARGGRIVLQLWHVGRISHPSLQPGGGLPVAPSAIAPEGESMTYEGMKPFVTPRALETEEVAEVVAEFARGTRLAREAGFDGVEVHAANGYLIDQFLRDGSNHRTDGYGGSVEKRARLLDEVTAAVVDEWAAGRVGVRLSPFNPFNSMRDSDPERTFVHAAGVLSRFGLAYLHVVEPVSDGAALSLTPRMRAAFGGALMGNGGYTAERAQAEVRAGTVDLVSFGVPYLANPDLAERFAEGAPLNEPDRSSFYGGDERGYVDYPFRREWAA